MANAHGDFIWYELMTPDPAGAKAFYDAVVGWNMAAQGSPMPGGVEYREILAQDGSHAGGVLTLTPDMAQGGARPAWIGYVGVENVDEAVARAQEAGGSVLMEPMDMEGIGRMALIADPFGAPIYVMRGHADMDSKAYQMMSPGHVAWNELSTPDPDAARSFYYALFNWTDGEAMPMGELGTYQMFDQNGQSIGGIMRMPEETMPPSWLYYIAVRDIDEAHRTIGAQGGQVLAEPQEVPGGMFCINAVDPQGAMFAVVGARRQPAES